MNNSVLKQVLKPALLLAAFALVGVLLLDTVNRYTLQRIEANERNALMRQLMQVVDKNSHDNDLLHDSAVLPGKLFHSSSDVTIYRARKQGRPSAAIFVTTTDKGYKGSIQIVIGIRMDRSISGVRVVRHNETPGLGDKMELQKSPWVLDFDNTSLQQPALSQWAVKRDGGYFDQFTGATITPRAIVGAVRDVLLWSNEDNHLLSVFSLPTTVGNPSEASDRAVKAEMENAQ